MAKSLRQHRHKARILAMQALFQADARGFSNVAAADLMAFQWMDYAAPAEEQEFARRIIGATFEHLAEIDALITDRLVNWEFDRISPVSRAILRTGVAQLLYLKEDAEAAVVIDESILLAKQYDAAETTGFINGVMDEIRLGQGEAPKLAQKIKVKKKR